MRSVKREVNLEVVEGDSTLRTLDYRGTELWAGHLHTASKIGYRAWDADGRSDGWKAVLAVLRGVRLPVHFAVVFNVSRHVAQLVRFQETEQTANKL